MANDCQNCEHKKLNPDPENHCYMFKEEFPDCQQYKPIGQPRTVHVGTIGHISHTRHMRTATLIGALLGRHLKDRK